MKNDGALPSGPPTLPRTNVRGCDRESFIVGHILGQAKTKIVSQANLTWTLEERKKRTNDNVVGGQSKGRERQRARWHYLDHQVCTTEQNRSLFADWTIEVLLAPLGA